MPHVQICSTLHIGRIIAELRRGRGMTLRQLGEQLGVSAQAVHKWERGINYPDITLIPALARVFGVPISALLGETVDFDSK